MSRRPLKARKKLGPEAVVLSSISLSVVAFEVV